MAAFRLNSPGRLMTAAHVACNPLKPMHPLDGHHQKAGGSAPPARARRWSRSRYQDRSRRGAKAM